MARVYLGSHLRLSVIPKVNRTGQPQRQCDARGRTQCSLADTVDGHHSGPEFVSCLSPELVFSVICCFVFFLLSLLRLWFCTCAFADFFYLSLIPLSPAHPSTLFYPLKSLVGSPDWAADCVCLCLCAHRDQSEALKLSLSALVQNQTLLNWIRPKTSLGFTCSAGHRWRQTVAFLSHSKWIHSQLWGRLQDTHSFAGTPDPTTYS